MTTIDDATAIEYSMLSRNEHGATYGEVPQPPVGTQLVSPAIETATDETFFYEHTDNGWVLDPGGAEVPVQWDSLKMTLAMYACVVRRWGK